MREKRITLTFDAKESTLDAKLEQAKVVLKDINMDRLEYGTITVGGITYKIEKLMDGGPI